MGERDVVNDDDAIELCGETYDHRLDLIDERDGERVYECRECGAEIREEADRG